MQGQGRRDQDTRAYAHKVPKQTEEKRIQNREKIGTGNGKQETGNRKQENNEPHIEATILGAYATVPTQLTYISQVAPRCTS